MWTYMRKIMYMLGNIASYKICVTPPFAIGFVCFALVDVFNGWANQGLGV